MGEKTGTKRVDNLNLNVACLEKGNSYSLKEKKEETSATGWRSNGEEKKKKIRKSDQVKIKLYVPLVVGPDPVYRRVMCRTGQRGKGREWEQEGGSKV